MSVLEQILSPERVDVLRRAGLHKVAGALVGCGEMGLREAVTTVSAKAYVRRKTAVKIAEGIAAFDALTEGRVASDRALQERLRAIVAPGGVR